MNILFLTSNLRKCSGGPVRYILKLAEYLSRHGHDVHILSFRTSKNEYTPYAGVVNHKLNIEIDDRMNLFRTILPLLRETKKIIQENNIEILHMNTTLSNILGVLMKSKKNNLVLVRAVLGWHVEIKNHSKAQNRYVRQIQQQILANSRTFLEKITIMNNDATITVSPELREYAINCGANPKRISVIPCGVDILPLPLLERKEETMNKLHLELKPTIVFIGSIRKTKGIGYLLQAAKRLPDYQFILIGEGPDLDAYKDFAKKLEITNIRFEGYVEDELLHEYFAVADLFCLPSFLEGVPMAMLEAMSYGVPPLVTNIGGNPTVIEHGRNGYLIPPGNSAAIRHAIKELFDNPDKLKSIGENARKTIESKYAWDIVSKQIEKVYLTSLDDRE
ncbi:MAG: glycosyltransferase family 4 protein [Thermoplasmata archaeon]